MKRLNRYIFAQFARTWLFATTAFISLFIIVTAVERMDSLIDHHVATLDIITFFLLTIPATLLLTAPLSTLLASILVAGRLALSGELAALRASGLGMRHLLTPFMAGGLIITALNLLNATLITPAAWQHTNRFEERYFTGDRLGNTALRNIHLIETGNQLLSIEQVENSGTDDPTLLGVSLQYFNGSRILWRADAPSMRYNKKTRRWIMQQPVIRTFNDDTETWATPPTSSHKLTLTPKRLNELNIRPEAMDLISHHHYLRQQQLAGISGLEPATVSFHNKIAAPFASLIIILTGVPLTAKKKRGGLGTEITIALFAGFLFLGIQKTIIMAGNLGSIPAIAAAWLPNLIFLATGIIIFNTTTD